MAKLIRALLSPLRWIAAAIMAIVRPKPKRNPESDMYPLW